MCACQAYLIVIKWIVAIKLCRKQYIEKAFRLAYNRSQTRGIIMPSFLFYLSHGALIAFSRAVISVQRKMLSLTLFLSARLIVNVHRSVH